MVLMRLAYHSSDARTGGTADNGSFETVTEDCAEYGSTRSPDEGSLAWTDTALAAVTVVVLAVVLVLAVGVVLTVVVPVVAVPQAAILPASAAAANTLVERLVAS